MEAPNHAQRTPTGRSLTSLFFFSCLCFFCLCRAVAAVVAVHRLRLLRLFLLRCRAPPPPSPSPPPPPPPGPPRQLQLAAPPCINPAPLSGFLLHSTIVFRLWISIGISVDLNGRPSVS